MNVFTNIFEQLNKVNIYPIYLYLTMNMIIH